ncbi:MAG: hypothetical protein B7Z54_08370 [Sphingobacteriales bacterium 12-47-4]|nr:MAG: hypothetical protein B7Z54_08370 [Sphingobacteriales bacterium 12-47-4]
MSINKKPDMLSPLVLNMRIEQEISIQFHIFHLITSQVIALADTSGIEGSIQFFIELIPYRDIDCMLGAA